MCKAVRDMIDESKQEGIAVGKAEGKAEGKLITLIDLVRDNSLS